MTTLTLAAWERRLVALAGEGDSAQSVAAAPAAPDGVALKAAYARCEAITAEHSRSFSLATRLLPPAKRPAMHALYAFCRTSDDIVDRVGDNHRAHELNAWRRRALSPAPSAGDLVATAWADTRARYAIPRRYAEQLLDGVTRDLYQQRYATFEELTTYAYGVASTVGLMSMHIIGYRTLSAIPYAIKLGVALQLTNILRDVGEDWNAGRVYLPQEELAAFNLTEADLAAGRVDERWRAFMRFQIARNRRLYEKAWPGIYLLQRDGRLAVAAAACLYRAILDGIEEHGYDVFHRRAHVNGRRKIVRLAQAWWRVRGPVAGMQHYG